MKPSCFPNSDNVHDVLKGISLLSIHKFAYICRSSNHDGKWCETQQKVEKTLPVFTLNSLRSWRYCVTARLKFWRRSRVPKKGSRDEAVFLAASPPVTAPPSNLTRLYYNGFAAKSHSTTTQYCQLCRLTLKGLFRWMLGAPGRCGHSLTWIKKYPRSHATLQPHHPGVHIHKII